MASAKKPAAPKGHAAHTQAADDPGGLPGRVERPLKIAFIGAGSNFCPRLLNDVLRIPGLGPLEAALVDVDAKRLGLMQRLVRRLFQQHGRDPGCVVASRDRRAVLAGAHYVVNSIEVAGVQCVDSDNDIPAKFGVDQCIGDTIGPGGLMKGLRTIPVWLDILRDCGELCPDALVLNYTNPMNMLCLAAGRASSMSVVGLCHSVQGTSHLLARRAGVPYPGMEWECSGVNHLAWFTRLEHQGRDLYPKLKRLARRDLAGDPADPDDAWDLVRKECMLQFGAFITESSGHLSEYLPWFRKRADIRAKYCGPAYHGGSRFYASEWPKWRRAQDAEREALAKSKDPIDWPRSWEYASWIIEAREKDAPFRIHGNVLNAHRGAGPLIPNLPADGCVEVACMVDRNGINPTAPGPLPAQMAALCDMQMRMFDLAATAAIERSKEAAVHALMMDPLSAACCSLAEIREMAEALFKAQRRWLPGYK